MKAYKDINLQLLLKQYTGINNIIRFINLDNYNDIDFNTFLDKQIEASHFWNNTFLNDKLFKKINKFCSSFDYFKFMNEHINETKNIIIQYKKSEETEESEESEEIEETKKTKLKTTNKLNNVNKKQNKKNIQKGGNNNLNIEKINYESDKSINSEDEIIGYLSDKDNSDIIDLSNINI
jgi:hypothetical protein